MQQTLLFPDKATSLRRLGRFERSDPTSKDLDYIWKAMVKRDTASLYEVEPRLLRVLGTWQAYRNQRSPSNERFLSDLAKIKAVRESLFRLVDVTYRSGSLRSILRLGSDIEAVYEFLKARMLRNVPARIVTVSKALLMIGGFSPGFDTNVLAAIRKSNPYILAASGVWPYCLFQEHLEFLASQQTAWEKQNGRMKDLRPGVPIGQIMDRILWS